MTVENGAIGAIPAGENPLKVEGPAAESQPLLETSAAPAPDPPVEPSPSHPGPGREQNTDPAPPLLAASAPAASPGAAPLPPYLGNIQVPSFMDSAPSSFSASMRRLPERCNEYSQAFFAAASAAVHESGQGGEHAIVGWYITPLPDCCTLDRLVFTPTGGAGPEGMGPQIAAKKTITVGAVLALAGLLILIVPSFLTKAIPLVLGACLTVAGIVMLVSFVLTLSNPGAYAFLLLAAAHLAAGAYMLSFPIMGAFWLCIIIAAWLIAKGVGRVSAWRSFHGPEGPPFWKVPHKSGVALIVTGVVLAMLSPYPFLLGVLVGYDVLLTGVLVAAAGLHALRSSRGGTTESDPLLQQQSVPAYTV